MSQLNPDAKEFIPISPTRSNGPLSPPLNGEMNPVNTLLGNFVAEDTVVSQSPRKGEFQPMEDMFVPSERDFDNEANTRPHEFDLLDSFQRIESPERLNLKESMQQDDKLEQEYKDEAFFEEEKQQIGDGYKVLESSFSEYSNGFQSIIEDPMNRSFYEGRDDGDIVQTTSDLLNSVQPIPTFEDEPSDGDHQNFVENDKPVADLMGESLEFQQKLDVAQAPPMDTSDNFEAERFVEEIKSANIELDKYVDQGLSPTIPEFSLNTIQTVQETMTEKLSLEPIQDSNLDTFHVEAPAMAHDPVAEPSIEFKEIPEVSEPPPTPAIEASEPINIIPEPEQTVVKLEQAEVKEEPKAEIMSGVAAESAVTAADVAVAAKKKPATKTDVKTKAPVAIKANPVPIKRTPAVASTATKAPAAKPSSATAPVKPITAKKIASTTAKPAPKPLVSSALAARPARPATSTVAAAKKPTTTVSKSVTVSSAANPTPATRTTALTKKPSVAASK